MLAEVMRHLLYRRRVQAARAWSDAERRDVGERNAAFRRILNQAVSDPAGRRSAS